MSECWAAGCATVCDMGANSVKALKQFGATERKPPFMFNNQEIVTAYDPPPSPKVHPEHVPEV
jgi:hypothetical protein